MPASTQDAIAGRIANELLTDAVVEDCIIETEDRAPADPDGTLVVEVYFKPGVMDPVADSTRATLTALGIACSNVRTGRRIEIRPQPSEREVERILALLGNSCIEDVVMGAQPLQPAVTPVVAPFELRHVEINRLSDAALAQLSRDRHLFLSLDEMRAIREHFDQSGRQPTDLELETLAQTWSEHCVHKTLKSAFEYRGAPFPLQATNDAEAAENGSVVRRYSNLLKDTIARVTNELIAEGRGPECLSVFEDNAGIIGFDSEYGIAFKVETHNHPSAIEPYGGAATGVGGCIRDILGCGLGAKPIANTDVFCVAPPDWPVDDVPKGVIHPKRVLRGVVRGVRDYGNRMGIPTVNGAVHFDPRYLGNPLVYCGCVGLIPRNRIA
ncbi:MAG: phosphoribosylformylglycinamidine synthase subunit PurS, partial [Planctomycetota bacterium]|nr:phosphoribosylformylglycinamidine synthase subunit PurS [Planctomycetota bacterium]